MPVPDDSPDTFDLALQFVQQTAQHVFLTGKAGTGKTTFLKKIAGHALKKTVVVAPTGVAAINAGGVTMHSLFQLPFGVFLPSAGGKQELLKNIHFNAAKRELLRELELLVIDEISMVRCDMLDAVDTILRHVRGQPARVFGGVQVLYIGDLYQLPPVVQSGEWEGVLQSHYQSLFFFDSLVTREAPPLLIELTKIYRQQQPDFIRILNNIRDKNLDADDLARLDKHYDPDFRAVEEEHFITLTTHNRKAQLINQERLGQLPGKLHTFQGEITGEFNDKSLPAEMSLQLKVGTQIMFIKNDRGESRRYYNGKIAVVERIDQQRIFVRFPQEKNLLELERETWKNIQYYYHAERDRVEERELGSFRQFPVRLAWAITIHKSQGLTFRKAIIDAGDSFAPGQVYVALSRLESMDGLVLRSRISPQAIVTEQRVLDFSSAQLSHDALDRELLRQRRMFIRETLLQSFDMEKLTGQYAENCAAFEHRRIPEKGRAFAWAQKQYEHMARLRERTRKISAVLQGLMDEESGDGLLNEQVLASSRECSAALTECLRALRHHGSEFKPYLQAKKYAADLSLLALAVERKIQALSLCGRLIEALGRKPDQVPRAV